MSSQNQTFDLYHAIHPTFQEGFDAPFSAKLRAGKRVINIYHYEKIATVTVEKKGQIFNLTQHFEADWKEDAKDDNHFQFVTEDDPRSTSVGDVIVNTETKEVFRYIKIGFKQEESIPMEGTE